ncbi:MAG TPA: response regulator receiver protein, partial [Candidatus Krumholzibacteria bacterium]|nr:response regulator receiver protein [Candidatus Krumholzibacteria bacterium]
MSLSDNWLRGGGEMGARIRAFDWAATSLGAPDTWSPALRTMVRILLANRFPHILWWGPDYIQFYNDPYRPYPGTKHPHVALGRPARECWPEIWHVIGPLIDTPFNGGPATWDDDIELEINRHGYVEESHFTIAYSPVPDDTVPSGIGGVLATVHEITDKVIGERRTVALRDLGARVGEAKSAQDACAMAAAALAEHAKDLPFALLYLLEPNMRSAQLCGAAGVGAGESVSPLSIDLTRADAGPWPLAEALTSRTSLVVDPIGEHFADVPPG